MSGKTGLSLSVPPTLPAPARIQEWRAGNGLLWLTTAAVLAALVCSGAWREAVQGVQALGWMVAPLALVHALVLWPDSRGWAALVRSEAPAVPGTYLWSAALAREAATNCLPLSGAAAFAVGVRLLARRGMPAARAVGVLVVESTMTLLSQFLFVLAGVTLWLMLARSASAERTGLLCSLGAGAVAPALLLWIQRGAGVDKLLRWIRSLRQRMPAVRRLLPALRQMRRIYGSLDRLYARPRACLHCVVWQLTTMLAGVLELFVVLGALGLSGGLGQGLVTALLMAGAARLARSFAFFVPAGLGVQEVLFGGLCLGSGLSFQDGLAVSMAMRARDLAFGLPVLLAWITAERRTLGDR